MSAESFVRCARKHLGKPYATFRDCSGFTAHCAREAGIAIPEGSVAQFGVGQKVKSSDPLQSGDLAFWDTFGPSPGHVAIYVGDEYVIHAINEYRGIIQSRVDADMGGPYVGARRLDFGDSDIQNPEHPATNAAGAVTPQTPFRETGNTTRQAFTAALARTIGGLPPPLAEADAIYDALFPHGLTRLGAGMAWIERRNETDPGGLAYYGRERHNLWAVKRPNGTWMFFPSYEEAAIHWGAYVLGSTYADLSSIAQFIGRYAPWSDGNDPTKYGQQLAEEINRLPLLEEPMPEPTPIPWSPVIYDLRNDAHAQRFGLAPAERDVILSRGAARKASSIQAIQLHVQWGVTSGSLRHWLGVDASATVMVQRDGSILRVIPELRVPWTGGDVQNPDAEARRLMERFGRDPNQYSLTIEAEDERTEEINAAQERTIVWQVREWARKYGAYLLDPARILGHYQINAVDRARCGRYAGRIEAQLAAGGPLPEPLPGFSGLPAWLPEDALRASFPLADPAGAVTKAVIAWAAETGRVPWFVGKTDLGNGRNLWRFEGVTFLSAGVKVWQEGKAA